jgi:hypothetical protein
MAFEILAALALGFVIGRIWQIRRDELDRRNFPTRRDQAAHPEEARRIAANIAKLLARPSTGFR